MRRPVDGPRYIVLRHAASVPAEHRVPRYEGLWIEHDPFRVGDPWPAEWPTTVRAVARPTGRTEVRDDGESAQVWEIRLVDERDG